MPRPFVQLTLGQFAERLRAFPFTRRVTAVHMHHTWNPSHADYRGLATIEGMYAFHTAPKPNGNGWSDIGQHLSIAPDGTVWTGRDWDRTPASATGFNDGAFMFETIGNFDVGHDVLAGRQRAAAVDVIALVQLRFGLPLESLHFHREFTDAKTCPGTGVRKADILAAVRARRAELTGGARELVAVARELSAAGVATSRHAPFPGDPAAAADAFSRDVLLHPTVVDDEDAEASCDPGTTRDDGEAREVDTAAAARGGLAAEELETLRPHVVDLRQGRFSSDGLYRTTPADVDAIVGEHLPRAIDEARQRGERLRVLVWAHGGLVDEAAGLRMALQVIPWWMRNRVYPIYFVWETGFWETLSQLLAGRRELEVARDLWDLADRPLEELARAVGGGKIWDGMKLSAQRAHDPDGGARYVAGALAALCAAHPEDVELHAVGHSAGAIFHSHFVPAALDAGAPPFATLSLLAPAVRVAEFHERLAPRIGRGVDALTLFTMKQDLEGADDCATIYHKSLLYLIHNALEARRGEPILGLEESIRADDALAALFGLGTHARGVHEVVWSRTTAAGGRSASRSTSHGGFDNDRATMESVLRRVLGVADTAAVQPFPEEATRAFAFDPAARRPRPKPARPSAPAPAPAPVAAPAVVTPGRTGAPRLTRALCVGIDYPGDAAALHGCVADARTWAAQLRALGFAEVELLTDAAATEDAMRARLDALVRGARPGESVVFQYAGHGTTFTDRDGDEASGEDQAVVPVDFRAGRFLLDDEIFELCAPLADGASLTSFFDCCHSGTMSRAALLGTMRALEADGDVRPRFIDPTPEMRAEYRRRRAERRLRAAPAARGLRDANALRGVTFSACRDIEVALERGGHGVFTTRVTPLIAAALADGMPNAEFQRRVEQAFAGDDGQHPALDCADAARGRALFGVGGARAGDGLTPARGDGRTIYGPRDDAPVARVGSP